MTDPCILQEAVLAGAIDALVRSACAAHGRQFLGDCLPGAMESYGRIIGRRAPGPGKRFHGFSTQINLLDGCTVLRLQVADHFLNAGTGLSLEFRFVILLPVGNQLIHNPGVDHIVPVVVGDGVSQYPVEPCNRTLRLPQLTSVLNSFHIGCLQDVFGRCRITNPGAEKLQEPVVHPRQVRYRFLIPCQLRRDHDPRWLLE
jgi:hypothetical protein